MSRGAASLELRLDAAGAILMASENAVKVSPEAIQALGGAGYTKEHPVERLLRDAKLDDIGAGYERDPAVPDRTGAPGRRTTTSSDVRPGVASIRDRRRATNDLLFVAGSSAGRLLRPAVLSVRPRATA